MPWYANPRSGSHTFEDMASSYHTANNTQSSTMKSSLTIPITLTSLNDPSDRRNLTLGPGEHVTIGRASKSDAKDLRASSTNALFDCPVVSRRHAELKAHLSRDAKDQVTITDRESMHGTSVNGVRLAPHLPFSLASGDVIKFGEKVVRGSDTHDGVKVTFARSTITTKQPTQTGQLMPTSSRTYHAPSGSDMDSDEASENESVWGEVQHISSSAKTTPEQTKSTQEQTKLGLGSQAQPIDVDTSHAVRAEIIDLDDDLPPSAQKPAEGAKAVKDTYAESEDAESIHDDEQESEDGVVAGYLDNLSDSDASDLSNHHYDESGEVSEAEGPELMSSKKAASPELGTPEDTTARSQQNAFGRPYLSSTAPTYPAYPEYPPHASTGSRNMGMSRPYDPIRGSYPPSINYQDISGPSYHSPRYPAPLAPARAPSTYTYGYPGGAFGGPFSTKPTADSYNRSGWDVPPQRALPLSQSTRATQSYYTPMDLAPSAASASFDADLRGLAADLQSPPVVGSAFDPVRYPSVSVIESERERESDAPAPYPAPAASCKDKISIPAIVDTISTTATGHIALVSEPAITVENVDEVLNHARALVDVANKKRKADDIFDSDSAADLASSNTNERSPAEQTPAKKARTIKSVGAGIAKYATAALAGGVGMTIFLASPMAQQLLEL